MEGSQQGTGIVTDGVILNIPVRCAEGEIRRNRAMEVESPVNMIHHALYHVAQMMAE